MQKVKIFLILIAFIVLFANYSDAQTRRANKPKSKKPIKLKRLNKHGCFLASYSTIGGKLATVHYNCPPFIDKVNLSQTEVAEKCPFVTRHVGVCAENAQLVEITTEARDPENDPLLYFYKVSAGKIIGEGSKVVWDLSNVKPGKYTVSVYADDGCGQCRDLVVKEVTVIECPECHPPLPPPLNNF